MTSQMYVSMTTSLTIRRLPSSILVYAALTGRRHSQEHDKVNVGDSLDISVAQVHVHMIYHVKSLRQVPHKQLGNCSYMILKLKGLSKRSVAISKPCAENEDSGAG